MKNVCSFLLFLLISNAVFGQIEWVGNQLFSDSTTDIVRTLQNQYVLLHSNGSGITVFDSDGDIVFEDSIITYTGYGSSDIIEFPDSSLMLVLGGVDCDINLNFYLKFDKNWNLTGSDFCYGGGNIAKFSDNSIAIVNDFYGYLEKLSFNGTQLWLKDFYSMKLFDLVVTIDDTMLLATEQGLIKLTPDGIIVDTMSDLIFYRLEMLPNGNFLALANNVLSLYDSNFTLLSSFEQAGNTIQDITFDQNQIAALTNAPEIIRLNLNLNNIGDIPLTGHNQTFNALALADNGFLVGGGEQYGNNGHKNTAAFIKHYGLDGSTDNTNEDIELTSVSQSGQIGVEDYFGIYEIKIPNIDLLVTNKGTETVHSLTANIQFSDLNGLWECPVEQKFSKTFENLNLQPGTSMHLIWDEVKFGTWDYLAGQNLDLCLWTSLPNHHLETNNDNDVACAQVTVATKELQPVAFEQYFNPVADELNIALKNSMGNEQAMARVFNATGQLVHSEAVVGERQTLQLHRLADGSYFLQIVAGQRVGWGKFVKY